MKISRVVIPAHLWPKTLAELYRIVAALPTGVRVEVVDVRDGRVYWR